MTPNFALTLSFDGIQLLHKADDGWHLIGGVEVDDPALNEKLADLCAQAEALEGGPIRCKLLLPPEQIKFTAIDSTMTTEDDVKAALDGATPYPVEDLVIDHDRSGGRTHIAAVALETLQEAEAFATEHGFNPVAFAAIAEPYTFRHEVFFGPTKAAASLLPPGVEAERSDPVRVTGQIDRPKNADAPADAPKKDAPEPKVEAPEAGAGAKAEAATDDLDVADTDPVDDTPDDVTTDGPTEDDPEQEVLFTRRKDAPVLTASRAATEDRPTGQLNLGSVSEAAPAIGAASLSTIEPSAQPAPREPDPVMVPTPPANKPVTKAEAVIGRGKKQKVRGKPRYLGLFLTLGLLIFLFIVALWANTLSEDGIAGWFKRSSDLVELEPPAIEPEMLSAPMQAPDPTPDEDVATTVPSPSLPIVRAPAGRVLSPAEADRIYAATGVYQRAPRLPITPRENNLENLISVQALLPASSQPLPAFPALAQVEPDPSIAAPNNPPPAGTRYLRDLRGFILAMPEGVVTPEGALVIAGRPTKEPPARPGTEPLPVTAVEPVVVDPESFRLIGGRPPIEPPARPEGLAPEVLVPEVIEDVAPEGVPDVAPEDSAPELIADPAVEPTAAVPDAPSVTTPTIEIIAEQPTQPAEGPEVAEAEVAQPDTESEPEVAVVDTPEAATTDTDIAAIQGLVAEALQSPVVPPVAEVEPVDQVNIVEGRPSRVPPLRPSGFADLTPDDIANAARDLQPSLVVDPDVVGFRPSQRPSGLVSEAVLAALSQDIPARPTAPEAEPETPQAAVQTDVGALAAAIAASAPEVPFANVTSQAVARSQRPDVRPRNFSQVVARAQAASAARPQQTAAAVSNLPAAASGPIPGGVARAATVDNAIRLRDINLIGVYGRPNDRRALVRLSNGRFIKVEVGSNLDGGRVTAINDSALNYVKRGRTVSLELPSG